MAKFFFFSFFPTLETPFNIVTIVLQHLKLNVLRVWGNLKGEIRCLERGANSLPSSRWTLSIMLHNVWDPIFIRSRVLWKMIDRVFIRNPKSIPTNGKVFSPLHSNTWSVCQPLYRYVTTIQIDFLGDLCGLQTWNMRFY